MWKAFRQIPIHPSVQNLLVVCFWNRHTSRWVYGLAHALPFGLSGAVINFNRLPSLLAAIARRWLAIPVQHFFDDFRIIDMKSSNGSAFRWFSKLVQLIGVRFDSTKDQLPTTTLPLLGNLEHYGNAGATECFLVEAKPERLRALEEEVRTLLAKKSCSRSVARTLRGKLINLSFCKPGKLGRGMLHGLNLLAEGVLQG